MLMYDRVIEVCLIARHDNLTVIWLVTLGLHWGYFWASCLAPRWAPCLAPRWAPCLALRFSPSWSQSNASCSQVGSRVRTRTQLKLILSKDADLVAVQTSLLHHRMIPLQCHQLADKVGAGHLGGGGHDRGAFATFGSCTVSRADRSRRGPCLTRSR